MTSKTNEQALEAAIKKALTGTTREALAEANAKEKEGTDESASPYGGGLGYLWMKYGLSPLRVFSRRYAEH